MLGMIGSSWSLSVKSLSLTLFLLFLPLNVLLDLFLATLWLFDPFPPPSFIWLSLEGFYLEGLFFISFIWSTKSWIL